MDSAQTVAKSEKEELRGLYLVPPHGELIASGKKRSIAKSRQFNLEGKWILVSGKNAFGVMEIGEPEKVSTDEFDKKYEDHLVGRRDRLRWWPEANELWLYPVQAFQAYDQPKKVEVPPGVQTVMQEVDFKQRSGDLLAKLEGLPDKFVWVPDFVSVTGSQIYAKGREPKDVDVILRAEMAEDGEHFQVPVDGAMALKLERLLRDLLGTEGVQYTANAYGPNWKHLPLYDLALVRKSRLAYVEPNEAEFAAMEYKAWRAGEKGWVTLKDGRRVFVGGSERRGAATAKGEVALRAIERRILPEGMEFAYAVRPNGTQVFRAGGEYDCGVPITDEQTNMLKDAILTHNHPLSGSSFSRDDVDHAIGTNMAEIRVVGRDPRTGTVYTHRLTRPEKGWPPETALGNSLEKLVDKVENDLWGKVGDGRMSPKEADYLLWHKIWEGVGADLGMDYSREKLN